MKKGIFTILFLSITVFVFSQNNNGNREEKGDRQGGIYTYVDTKDAETLLLAKENTDQAKAEAIAEATRLANVAQANAISEAVVLANSAKNTAIARAKLLSSKAKQEAIAEATRLANDAIAEAVILANQARDEAIARAIILVNAARSYTDSCISKIELSSSVNVASGNVGIGTTDPDAKFEVKTDDGHLARFSYTGDNSNPQLDVLGLPNKIDLRTNDYSISKARGKGIDLSFSTSNTNDALIIKESGNVGIGISIPTKKLDVSGDINFTGNLYKNGTLVSTGESSIWTQTGSNIYYNKGKIGVGVTNPFGQIHLDGTEGIHLQRSDWTPVKVKMLLSKYSGPIGGLRFMLTPDGNWANWKDVLFLSPLGRVGIGTTNPQSELAVKGKITTQEIEVTLDWWSDFVFDKNYNLLSIAELKSFIDKNNHLPDVPNEEEVLENGLNLGEMDALILQKVEELTLYIIQLENRISELENK